MEIEKILRKLDAKAKKIGPTMYLERKKRCDPHLLFDVPHKAEPMSAKDIARKFPTFAEEMDGSCNENTLLYFYKYNKERKVYEIQDPEMEEEVAELLGVEIFDETKKEETPYEARSLTEEEHQVFREHIQDIREKLGRLKDSFKN